MYTFIHTFIQLDEKVWELKSPLGRKNERHPRMLWKEIFLLVFQNGFLKLT